MVKTAGVILLFLASSASAFCSTRTPFGHAIDTSKETQANGRRPGFLPLLCYDENSCAEESEEEKEARDKRNDQARRRLAKANKNGKFQLLHCEIQCDSLFTDDGKLKTDQDNLLRIECLNELRLKYEEAEHFLPKHRILYIRDCMQDMFQRLAEGIRFSQKRILLGSPGVGKSILIFLAAIRQAQMIQPEKEDKKVIFVRLTAIDPFISVFLMEPHPELPSVVNVFYSREVPRSHNVVETVGDIQDRFDIRDRKKLAIFIDGPDHDDDETDRNRDVFNYFCTSGGYPLPKPEVLDAKILKIWVLSGWKKAEMVQALTALDTTTTDKQAQELYELCGGSIRRALRVALKKNSAESKGREIETIKAQLTGVVQRTPLEARVVPALRSNLPIMGAVNGDSMRTMFEPSREGQSAIQLVDSRFIFDLLRAESLATQPVREAYQLATIVEHTAARGWYFTELMHCWFHESSPGRIDGFVRSTGSQNDSPQQLNKANLYWVPSRSNFPNIDAAFVCNDTLICLQYTVANEHNFNIDTFKSVFIDNLGYLEFKRVAIYFVVPVGTDFQTTIVEDFSVDNNKLTNCTAVCKTIVVDPSTNELIAAALLSGIPGIMYEEHGDESGVEANKRQRIE